MPLLADSALEKMKTLPADIWLKIGLVIVVIVAVVLVSRKVMKVNKLIGGIILAMVASIVFFSWVYNRNEPKFLTPIVERIAPFFPTAGSYNAKQNTAPRTR